MAAFSADVKSGMRMRAERLRYPQALYTGASNPGTSRLKEFTVGFAIAVIAGA